MEYLEGKKSISEYDLSTPQGSISKSNGAWPNKPHGQFALGSCNFFM
jgi:hypothetical protein